MSNFRLNQDKGMRDKGYSYEERNRILSTIALLGDGWVWGFGSRCFFNAGTQEYLDGNTLEPVTFAEYDRRLTATAETDIARTSTQT